MLQIRSSQLSVCSIQGCIEMWSCYQCCVRVQVVKSESESSPLSPSPSQKKFWVRVTNLVIHIFNNCLSSKTWTQTTKCIECQSKQRNTARPLLLGLGRDSGPSQSRFLSPSQSEKKWTRVRVQVKWTRVRVPTRVTQHWLLRNPKVFFLCMYWECPMWELLFLLLETIVIENSPYGFVFSIPRVHRHSFPSKRMHITDCSPI